MLEFVDSNYIWSDSKSLRYDIYDEIIIMIFFWGVCGGRGGIEPRPALLITLVYIYIHKSN